MTVETKWIKKPQPDPALVEFLKDSLDVPMHIAILMAMKGIRDYTEAYRYFNPSPELLHDPFLMKDMDIAVNRIFQALDKGEKIMVYGDYDVDGTTAVSVVYLFLQNIYSNIYYYIPDRFSEGYGISIQGIEKAREEKTNLIIALDCGIKEFEAASLARQYGIDLIICDHHTPGDELPEATAILNPKRKDCSYPYKELSGCGIGFKLIQALHHRLDKAPDPLQWVDYVAVSIASDIVPMTGENRILEYLGLKKFNSEPSIPFDTMIKELQLEKKDFNVGDLVFIIGPRLNASGRMKHAIHTVDFLVENDPEKAVYLFKAINENNHDRKLEDTASFEEALEMINNNPELQKRKTTVLYKENWHKGVIGIVASRLTEHYYRPTILLTEEDGVLTGSARSVQGYDLYKAIEACSSYLLKFGGHQFAAGLTLEKSRFEEFSQAFEDYVSRTITQDQLIPTLEYDMELDLQNINIRLANTIERFGPFGPENMKPLFVSRRVFLRFDPRQVGSDNAHLKLALRTQNGSYIDAIGFGMGEWAEKLNTRTPIDICYSLSINDWNNKRSVQLKLKDIKLSN